MKIVKLKAENIKKLIAVEITPEGNVVKITGKNGAGKTSVLDSIEWALAGGEHIPAQPIRRGAKKGSIEIDLGDMIVHRTFTHAGSQLVIESKDGQRLKSPQALLNDLLGRLTFDPLEFMRMKPRDQFETLRALTGVDLTDLEKKRAQAFDVRTEINREAKQLASRIAAIMVPADASDEEISSAEIGEKIRLGHEQNRKNEVSRSALLTLQDKRITLNSNISDTMARVADLQEQLRKMEADAKELDARIINGKEHCGSLEDVDVEVLQRELATVDDRNRAARLKKEKAALRKSLAAAEQRAEACTSEIARIDEQKVARVEAAKFPLYGLAFGEDVVTYCNLPLDQASSAEQLRVSIAMAMALNPKLRVIRVTDGSLLDSHSMEIIEEMAKNSDYQVWIEMVDESGKVGIVIEDGHLAGQEITETETTGEA